MARLGIQKQGESSNTLLRIHLRKKGSELFVLAGFGTHSLFYSIGESFSDFEDICNKVYNLLDSRIVSKDLIEPFIGGLEYRFFDPIRTFLKASSQVEFIVPNELIRFPFDLLHFHGLPIFLQKPVQFRLEEKSMSKLQFSKNWSAVIVSDKTADPERGTLHLTKILSSYRFYDIDELNLTRLNSMNCADVLLMSAHGKISFDKNDHVMLGRELIRPHHLSHLAAKLVYLDSCKLGTSERFLRSFKKAGTRYYLAPIVSNEAGNSSTRTIRLFFNALKQGFSPSVSLFRTRVKLFNYFLSNDTPVKLLADLMNAGIKKSYELVYSRREYYGNLLWRAFPFRVYNLN